MRIIFTQIKSNFIAVHDVSKRTKLSCFQLVKNISILDFMHIGVPLWHFCITHWPPFNMLKDAAFRILFITPCLCCLVLSYSKPVTKVELTKHTSSLFLFWY